MLHKFYGFTAPNIILFSMSPRLFKKLLDSSSGDYRCLYLLNKQFEELEKFLDSIPVEYVAIQDKRNYSKLKRLERDDPSNPMIEELRKSLSNSEMDVASFYLVNGERVEISDLSKSIIVKLKEQLDRIRLFHNQIDLKSNLVSEDEDYYFNIPLYRLRAFNESVLCDIFVKKFNSFFQTGSNPKEFWSQLGELVDGLSKYVPKEDETDTNEDLTENAVYEVESFVSDLDYSVLNNLFGEHSEEEYHNSSLELHKIGLVGFTPFVSELFNEFKNVYNPSYVSKIYINRNSDLFRFYTMCKRALDSNLELFSDLNPSKNKDVSDSSASSQPSVGVFGDSQMDSSVINQTSNPNQIVEEELELELESD